MSIEVHHKGCYVGTLETAHQLLKLGIYDPKPHRKSTKHCGIGYSSKHKKFYGWNHRSINGYKIGDVLKPGNLATENSWTDEYIQENPHKATALPVGTKLYTIDDCEKAAIAYCYAIR